MSIEILLNDSRVAAQNAWNNPKRSGNLLVGATFITVVAMTFFQTNPLTYPVTTLATIGILFFSLQHAAEKKQHAFTYTTFPTWYKEKNVFDSALLTNIWLSYKEKKVTAALAVTEKTTDISQRQDDAVEVLKAVQQKGVIAQIFNQQKGRGLAVRGEKNLYALGIDEEFVRNRQAALAYVENNLLCNPPKIKTAEQMEQFICDLHSLLAKDLVNSSGIPIPPGKYRKSIILLPKDNVGHENNAIVQNVKKKEPQSLQLFCQLVQRIKKSKDPSETLRQFSSEEARVLSLGYDTLYMDPKDIPEAMKKFCRDYLQKIKAKTDPLDLATWLHMEFIKIHPFIDLNGHTARTLASAELRRGDLAPIFIFDEDAYVKAQEKRNPAIFRAFLMRTINLSKKLGAILEQEQPLPRRQITLHD